MRQPADRGGGEREGALKCIARRPFWTPPGLRVRIPAVIVSRGIRAAPERDRSAPLSRGRSPETIKSTVHSTACRLYWPGFGPTDNARIAPMTVKRIPEPRGSCSDHACSAVLRGNRRAKRRSTPGIHVAGYCVWLNRLVSPTENINCGRIIDLCHGNCVLCCSA